MLDLSEVATYLTNKFNGIGKEYSPVYTFCIYAEIGKNNNSSYIQGVLTSQMANLTPINGIFNATYKMSVDLTVPAPRSNYNLKNVEDIVGSVAESINGTSQEFSTGSGFVTMSTTGTGNFKTEAGQGDVVILKFSFNVNYTENTISAGQKHWILEGYEIPFLSESVVIEKNGKTVPVNDRSYQQTFMTTQLKWYKFKFPYENSELCKMLQKDILEGSANKTYTLKYYDGISYTSENPFETKVILYRNGDSNGQKPETAMFDITFADADDGNNRTKYYLGVLDNEFDGSSDNERWFDSQDEQVTWYETRIGKVNDEVKYCEIKAPNLNSLALTNQIYTNDYEDDVFDLCNKNYAVIKVVKTIDETTTKTYRFYYRVTNANIGADNQVLYDLRIDSVQTYLFNPDLVIDDSFIEKAHLNRWIDNGDGTVSFNGGYDSELFKREDIREVAQRLTSRSKLLYYKYSGDTTVIDWLNNNVICWVYIYATLDKKTWYNGYSSVNRAPQSIYSSFSNYSNIPYGYCVFCYPIYKNNAKIVVQDDYGVYEISSGGFSNWKDLNGGYSYIYTMKLSIKPPFDISYNYDVSTTTVIGEDELILKGNRNKENGVVSLTDSSGNELDCKAISLSEAGTVGLFYVIHDYNNVNLAYIDIWALPKTDFNKSDIASETINRDIKFNPKINSQDYKSLKITFAGSSYDYDLQKLNLQNTSNMKFTYTERLTADITKGIVRLASSPKYSSSAIFGPFYKTSFNGFSYSNDLSLSFSTDKLDEYLSNNKNAYLSFQNQQDHALKNASISMISSLASSGANGLVNIATTGVNTLENLNYNQIQFDLSIDNMKNSPDELSSNNGNAIFTQAVDEFGIYIELYRALDKDLKTANDIMYKNGYTLSEFEEDGKSIKDYCHTRKYFNYIKAVLGNIHGVSMSETVRNDIKQKFAEGIRFWHQDTINYEKENYELSLES